MIVSHPFETLPKIIARVRTLVDRPRTRLVWLVNSDGTV
jgi:hypothetical protein